MDRQLPSPNSLACSKDVQVHFPLAQENLEDEVPVVILGLLPLRVGFLPASIQFPPHSFLLEESPPHPSHRTQQVV